MKENRKKASADTRIVDVREKVNQAFKIYSASPTSDNELLLQEQKRPLQEKYNWGQEEKMVQNGTKSRISSPHKPPQIELALIKNLT